jgi:orotate phosphoribosyltransferase
MNQAKIKQQILKEVVAVKNFMAIKPSFVSVGPVPLKCNSRLLFSYPKIVRLFCAYLAPATIKAKPDFVVGIETAGIPLAMALSLKTNIPFVYARKVPKVKGGISQGLIEGDFRKGSRAVLVDDALGYGTTKLVFIKNLKKAGIKITDIVFILKTKSKLDEKFTKLIKKEKIKMHYVYEWPEVVVAGVKYQAIPAVASKILLDYTRRPDTWSDNYKKWHQYCLVLKKLNTKIPEFLKKYE